MSIELTTQNLQKLCRICMNDGKYNIWTDKLQVPSTSKANNKTEINEYYEVNIQDIFQLLGKTKENLLLGKEMPLICKICSKDFITLYSLHKRMEESEEQIWRLYQGGTICESNEENLIEYLMDEDLEMTLMNQNEMCEESLRDEEMTNEETEKYSLIKETINIYKVDRAETHFHDDDDDGSQSKQQQEQPTVDYNRINIAKNCNLKRDRDRKTVRRKSNHKTHNARTLVGDGSLIVSQFLPTSSQLPTESLDMPDDPDSNSVVNDALPKELRTMEYAAVVVKSKDIEHVSDADTLSSFKAHISSFDEEKTVYVCKYCPQAFSGPNYLMTHIRKSHVCKFCTKAFPKYTDLYVHIRGAHRQHICAICHKELSSHSNLRKHIKHMHGVNLPAQVALLDYHPAEGKTESSVDSTGVDKTSTQLPSDESVIESKRQSPPEEATTIGAGAEISYDAFGEMYMME